MPKNEHPKRLKVLLSAYACEPYKGSEGGVGWNWVKQISRFHDVWVITRANNKSVIEEYLKTNTIENVNWIYFDLPKWISFWKKGNKGVQVYYFFWQIFIFFVVKKYYRLIKFDIIHHLTFGTYWMPTFLAFLPCKFIWGPVGGGETTPKGFFWEYSFRGKLFEILRNSMRFIAEMNPIMWLIASNSSIVFATTDESAERLKKLGAKNVTVHPQVGMNINEINFLTNLPKNYSSNFIILSIGRLLHWKGFHLSIKAFAKFHKSYPNTEYWIINDGAEKKRLLCLAKKLNVEENVIFFGKLNSLESVHEKLGQCDILVHPALHEAFGNVCLEALAAGKPVVCLDHGGPAIQVNSHNGIKLKVSNSDELINDMANAFSLLANNYILRKKLGDYAINYVREEFNWEEKGNWLKEIYENI